METRQRERLDWAYKLGVVLPPILVVLVVYLKSWMSGWPVGPGGAGLLAAVLAYVAFCHLVGHNKAVLGRTILVGWSVSAACFVGWIALTQVKKHRARPEPPPQGNFIGNQIAGYLEDAPAWWATYAEEFRQAWYMKWHPYLRWRHRPFAGQWLRINAAGNRETWNPTQPGTNRFRVFAFGGSVMWGTGARNEFTIPSHISRGLNTAGLPVEVTNFAESGYVTTQEVLQLLLELRAGNIPDVVVFLDGVNDIFAAFQNREVGVPQNESNMRSMLQEFLDRKHLEVNEGRMTTNSPPIVEAVLTDSDLIDQELATYVKNVELIEILAKHYRFQALYYWQPVAFAHKTLTSDEITRVAKQGPKMAEFFRLAYARVPTHKLPDRFHDLSQAFSGITNSFYLDLCHFREEGNEVLARPMVDDLVKLLSKSGSPRAMTRGAETP